MRALLVEDDALRGRAMKRWLEREGYEVFWRETAASALEALMGPTGFDLVSLDHDLGGAATGQDVAEAITRMTRELRPARVEVHTGNDAAADRMLALLRAAGVDAHRKELGT